jgi:hypothetical protein
VGLPRGSARRHGEASRPRVVDLGRLGHGPGSGADVGTSRGRRLGRGRAHVVGRPLHSQRAGDPAARAGVGRLRREERGRAADAGGVDGGPALLDEQRRQLPATPRGRPAHHAASHVAAGGARRLAHSHRDRAARPRAPRARRRHARRRRAYPQRSSPAAARAQPGGEGAAAGSQRRRLASSRGEAHPLRGPAGAGGGGAQARAPRAAAHAGPASGRGLERLGSTSRGRPRCSWWRTSGRRPVSEGGSRARSAGARQARPCGRRGAPARRRRGARRARRAARRSRG